MSVPSPIRLQKSINNLMVQLELLAHSTVIDLNQLKVIYESVATSEFREEWPFQNVLPLLRSAMQDGLDNSEAEKLRVTLLGIVGAAGKPLGLGLDESEPIIFEGKSFCFTGVFEYGQRSKCYKLIESFRGIAEDRVTLRLNYLVIGKFSSPDWKYSKYGRKIERAVEIREKKTGPIKIASEDFFISCVQKPAKSA